MFYLNFELLKGLFFLCVYVTMNTHTHFNVYVYLIFSIHTHTLTQIISPTQSLTHRYFSKTTNRSILKFWIAIPLMFQILKKKGFHIIIFDWLYCFRKPDGFILIAHCYSFRSIRWRARSPGLWHREFCLRVWTVSSLTHLNNLIYTVKKV